MIFIIFRWKEDVQHFIWIEFVEEEHTYTLSLWWIVSKLWEYNLNLFSIFFTLIKHGRILFDWKINLCRVKETIRSCGVLKQNVILWINSLKCYKHYLPLSYFAKEISITRVACNGRFLHTMPALLCVTTKFAVIQD